MLVARVMLVGLVCVVALLGVGCASHRSASTTNEVAIDAGGYASAFEAAREVLRDERFTLDRVDAQLGVITTRPKRAQGLAAAWEGEQSSIGDEVEDFAHRQQRTVRVRFVQADQRDALEPSPATFDAPGVAIVEVGIERVMMPGLRPQPRALGLTRVTTDPALSARGVWAGLPVVVRQDDDLAMRLAGKIAQRMHEHAER